MTFFELRHEMGGSEPWPFQGKGCSRQRAPAFVEVLGLRSCLEGAESISRADKQGNIRGGRREAACVGPQRRFQEPWPYKC